MAEHYCISQYVETWTRLNLVGEKSDSELLRDISDTAKWYTPGDAASRLFMRMLKQEAHKRGLGT